MKKQVYGRQLKRDTNERKALFKGLVSALTMYERIETTEEKAKSIKGHIEKLVTKAKRNESVQARRLLEAYMSHEAMQKMLSDIAPRFIDRPGGYTRILKIGNRFNDNASMVIMEWVEKGTKVQPSSSDKTTKSVKNPTKDKVALTAEVTTKKTKPTKKSTTKSPVKRTTKKTVKKEVAK